MALVRDESGTAIFDSRGSRVFDEYGNEQKLLDVLKEKYTLIMLMDAQGQAQHLVKVAETTYRLGLIGEVPSLTGYQTGWLISDAQTGNGNSEVFDFGSDGPASADDRERALVRIVTAVGSTPTCTYAVQGSLNQSSWFNLVYGDISTPDTYTSSTFTVTSATTVVKVIKAGQKYRYVRVVYSANTNVTNTTDIYPLGDVT